jgi:hypothetical protein
MTGKTPLGIDRAGAAGDLNGLEIVRNSIRGATVTTMRVRISRSPWPVSALRLRATNEYDQCISQARAATSHLRCCPPTPAVHDRSRQEPGDTRFDQSRESPVADANALSEELAMVSGISEE